MVYQELLKLRLRSEFQTVDRTELTGNVARVRVDRVFQGPATEEFQFTWYTHHVPAIGGGVIGSGPPTADFRPHKRYLIFLTQKTSKWVVAMRCTHLR